jgi:hypothetical protein
LHLNQTPKLKNGSKTHDFFGGLKIRLASNRAYFFVRSNICAPNRSKMSAISLIDATLQNVHNRYLDDDVNVADLLMMMSMNHIYIGMLLKAVFSRMLIKMQT